MTINTALRHLARRNRRLTHRIAKAQVDGHKLPQWDVSEKKAIEVATEIMLKHRVERGRLSKLGDTMLLTLIIKHRHGTVQKLTTGDVKECREFLMENDGAGAELTLAVEEVGESSKAYERIYRILERLEGA